jgi:pimeloyl-ACP methyl ester carboxylesterase
VPSPIRRGPARTVAKVIAGVALGALSVSMLVSVSPAGASLRRSSTSGHTTSTVWLCRPGLAHDPCTVKPTLTSIAANGTRSIETATPATPSGFDCFYVYPTVSSESTENANLVIQPIERDVAVLQASPFSQLCDVWAPMYRQTTAGDIAAHGIAGLPRAAVLTAYRSMLAGWKDFLAHHDDGRPIVLIGHSQGAALLIRLIRRQIDPDASLRRRLVVAILAGGNLQVPSGKTVGATFRHVPLCTKTGETGCAIAWSSFPSEPPESSPFGRPGKGVSVQAGETTSKGQRVACTDPAALGGGTGALEPYFVREQFPALSPAPSTLWVTFPGLYTAHCAHARDVTWLQVDHASGTGRPVVPQTTSPGFGYHGADVNLSLGNLLGDVAAAEASYRAHS